MPAIAKVPRVRRTDAMARSRRVDFELLEPEEPPPHPEAETSTMRRQRRRRVRVAGEPCCAREYDRRGIVKSVIAGTSGRKCRWNERPPALNYIGARNRVLASINLSTNTTPPCDAPPDRYYGSVQKHFSERPTIALSEPRFLHEIAVAAFIAVVVNARLSPWNILDAFLEKQIAICHNEQNPPLALYRESG